MDRPRTRGDRVDAGWHSGREGEPISKTRRVVPAQCTVLEEPEPLDTVGSGPLEITGRFLAFLLVLAGAALMPGPTRATPAAAGASA